jgi:glyoxylase-like metal-dependent hydrolase (beta-lactamase superfamily II)
MPAKIALMREAVGDKPIRYGMLTHHHSDHTMGITAYEDEGATLIASAAHEKVVREAAQDGDKLKVKTVDDRMVLEDGGRRVEIIDIGPTAHTEHLLVAYLPEEELIFEADHFTMPATGPAAPANRGASTFAEALARQDIKISRIATAHSARVATMDDLARALEAEVFQAMR